MKHNITYALTREEMLDYGYKQLGVQMCQSSLGNIMLFCENMRIAPKKATFFEDAQLHKSLVGYAKGFVYEELHAIESKFTDFHYDEKVIRLSYVLCNGQKEAIPIITDYYVSSLWLTLQNIWLRKKKQNK